MSDSVHIIARSFGFSGDAVPSAQVDQACEAGGEDLKHWWKQQAVSAVAPCAHEKTFTDFEKQGRGELAALCTQAKHDNAVLVSKYLKAQVFQPFSAELDPSASEITDVLRAAMKQGACQGKIPQERRI